MTTSAAWGALGAITVLNSEDEEEGAGRLEGGWLGGGVGWEWGHRGGEGLGKGDAQSCEERCSDACPCSSSAEDAVLKGHLKSSHAPSISSQPAQLEEELASKKVRRREHLLHLQHHREMPLPDMPSCTVLTAGSDGLFPGKPRCHLSGTPHQEHGVTPGWWHQESK